MCGIYKNHEIDLVFYPTIWNEFGAEYIVLPSIESHSSPLKFKPRDNIAGQVHPVGCMASGDLNLGLLKPKPTQLPVDHGDIREHKEGTKRKVEEINCLTVHWNSSWESDWFMI